MNKLVWLRHDLRIHDNDAFHHAFNTKNSGQVFACYCICDDQWDSHHTANAQRLLIIRTLFSLHSALKERGIALIVLDAFNFEKSVKLIHDLALELNCYEVLCAHDYPLNERNRDKHAHALLKQSNIQLKGFHHTNILPINAIYKSNGEQYQIFTPYKNRFLQHINSLSQDFISIPITTSQHWSQELHCPSYQQYEKQTLTVLKRFSEKYQSSAAICDLYLADENIILSQLSNFCDTYIEHYHIHRDIPQLPGTSQLSPYFSIGSLSVRRAYSQVINICANTEGAHTWINELIWREFYRNIMANNKRLSMGYTFKLPYQTIPWRTNFDYINAWQQGITGVPIVDAAMRQLNQTGWMHNRLRMVTAMFLTKYLCVDWRIGEAYFMQQLIDGDFASNNGGWQWSASTGTDAVPYFRVLSPIRQAQRFDVDAHFIKTYIPELSIYSAKDICNLNSKVWLDSNYPQPIIELSAAKNATIELFKTHLNQTST